VVSDPGGTRPPRADVLRRRVRQPTVIELPVLPERPAVPHPGRHAQVFTAALAVLILGGAALLASPWASESGDSTPPIDALFTAVSAAAVTGLVTVDTATHWNRLGEAVILVLIQAGGLGFMVGASIVLQALRRGTTRLSDVLLIKEGAPTLSLREAATLSRRIVVFTFATEAAGAVVLTLRFRQDMPLPEAIWFGVFHAVSAFCNAGFDLQGGFVSLAPYRESLVVNGAIMLLVQAGALSYVVLADVAFCRRWARFALDTKLVLLANGALLLAGAVAFLAAEWGRSLAPISPAARPMAALFQSVVARTAGYATVNFAEAHHVTLFIWVAIMLAGGASGSTAGGVKLTTIGVVVAAVVSTLRGQEETQLFGRRVPTPLVFRAMAVIAVMLAVHFVATAALAASEELIGGQEFGFIALMFETMSALATVGLSTGITPELTTAGKLVLCATMFFGRLGPLTVAYALQRRQQPARYRFPATRVRIG
jgi:trk system potassium uptake protein TrkH